MSLLDSLFRVRNIAWPCGLVYLRRYFITPEHWPYRLYLHHIRRQDWGRDPHCHPSWFVTVILSGGYREAIYDEQGQYVRSVYRRRGIVFRRATHVHRITWVEPGTWTLSLWGRRVREWGFYTRSGFVPWHQYERRSDGTLRASSM